MSDEEIEPAALMREDGLIAKDLAGEKGPEWTPEPGIKWIDPYNHLPLVKQVNDKVGFDHEFEKLYAVSDIIELIEKLMSQDLSQQSDSFKMGYIKGLDDIKYLIQTHEDTNESN
jgi:hypothetical protein